MSHFYAEILQQHYWGDLEARISGMGLQKVLVLSQSAVFNSL